MKATIKIDFSCPSLAEAIYSAMRGGMLREHAGYYARHRRDWEGYSHFANGSFQWETSAGNVLTAEVDGAVLTLGVSGYRHGIPWRFFGIGAEFCGFKPLDLLEESTWEADSQEPELAPWLTVGDRQPQDWRWLRRAGDRGTALVMITDDARREAEDRWPDAEYWDADAFSRGELDTQGFSIVIESFPESYQGIRRMMEADTVEFWNGIAVKGYGQS